MPKDMAAVRAGARIHWIGGAALRASLHRHRGKVRPALFAELGAVTVLGAALGTGNGVRCSLLIMAEWSSLGQLSNNSVSG